MISPKKDIISRPRKVRKKQEKSQEESAKKNDFYHLVQISRLLNQYLIRALV